MRFLWPFERRKNNSQEKKNFSDLLCIYLKGNSYKFICIFLYCFPSRSATANMGIGDIKSASSCFLWTWDNQPRGQSKIKRQLVLENRMPKKRKNPGVSPSRKIVNFDRTVNTVEGLEPSSRDMTMSQEMYSVNKEELFNSMSEMFSDLEPTVVYMVLSECDFKGKLNAVCCISGCIP